VTACSAWGAICGGHPIPSRPGRPGRSSTANLLSRPKPNQGISTAWRPHHLVLPGSRFETPHRPRTESGKQFCASTNPAQPTSSAPIDQRGGFLAELAMRLMGRDPIDWERLQDPVYVRQLDRSARAAWASPDRCQITGKFSVEGGVRAAPLPTPSGASTDAGQNPAGAGVA